MRNEREMLFSSSFILLHSSFPYLPKHPTKLRGTGLITRKDSFQIRVAQMLLCYLAEDIAEVCGQGQVAPFIKLARFEAGPLPIDTSAAHAVADDEHGVGVAVIRPARAVLARRPTEL